MKIPGNLKELEGLSWSSPETPVALGDNFEVYSADLRELKNILDERFDICIIDAFPGVETADLEAAVRDMVYVNSLAVDPSTVRFDSDTTTAPSLSSADLLAETPSSKVPVLLVF